MYFHMMYRYGRQQKAKRKNVPAGVRFSYIQGVSCPMR